MLLKHVVVAVMVGLGLTLHVIATRDAADRADAPADALRRSRTLRRLAQVIATLGAIVLLITAAAQDSA
jgi:putative copper export protein